MYIATEYKEPAAPLNVNITTLLSYVKNIPFIHRMGLTTGKWIKRLLHGYRWFRTKYTME